MRGLGVLLDLLLQALHGLLRGLVTRHAVGLEALLRVGGELGLPVALALLLLLEAVLLVLLGGFWVGVGWREGQPVFFFFFVFYSGS